MLQWWDTCRESCGERSENGLGFWGIYSVSNVWRSARNFIYKRILHADDTPHRIALGVALGTFVGFTPTMGAQTVIALALATLFRANKVVCLPFVWITNPFTFAPIYWACWRFGAALTATPAAAKGEYLLHQLEGYSGGGLAFLHSLLSYDFWASMVHMMFEIGVELWLGCSIVGLVAGGTLYLITKWTVVAYRARRHERIMRSHERRRRRQAARAARAAQKKVAATGETL